MPEYVENSLQEVSLNNAIAFQSSIPCRKGYVYHENGTGIFTLKGVTSNCFARYKVTYNGNIALPTGATVTPIAVSISVNGETKATSRAIFTPAAVGEYGNVTSTAIVTVPKGCCFSVAVRAVDGTTDVADTPAPTINVINSNLTIDRIA